MSGLADRRRARRAGMGAALRPPHGATRIRWADARKEHRRRRRSRVGGSALVLFGLVVGLGASVMPQLFGEPAGQAGIAIALTPKPEPPAAAPPAPAAEPAGPVFDVPGEEALGYADGRGFAHAAYSRLAGTECRLRQGSVLVWARDGAGGSSCVLVLFDRARLAPGWSVAGLDLRLGYGTAIDEGGRLSAAAANSGTSLTLDGGALPLRIHAIGTVPLAGAEHWLAIERVRFVGPATARRWHAAFGD